ncbi:hypothetical protein IF2G_00390 [Cordyceps javanica]|nr:hypothetical protein IF2G_00390 [Cordyceps javanica]
MTVVDPTVCCPSWVSSSASRARLRSPQMLSCNEIVGRANRSIATNANPRSALTDLVAVSSAYDRNGRSFESHLKNKFLSILGFFFYRLPTSSRSNSITKRRTMPGSATRVKLCYQYNAHY